MIYTLVPPVFSRINQFFGGETRWDDDDDDDHDETRGRG